jgi:glucose-1-phosphate cytidylyltransferase
MQLVILAGGLGSRISEETQNKPKPLVEICGKPIILYIMEHYASYGVKDFIICCGYKGEMLKNYFKDFKYSNSDYVIDLKNRKKRFNKKKIDWNINLVDTGQKTNTGGRLKFVEKYLEDDFCMTYGDGISTVNINKLIQFHYLKKKIATMTVVNPPVRFGEVEFNKNNKIALRFEEKVKYSSSWINGGFFVINKKALRLINSKKTAWEKEPLNKIVKNKNLACFEHKGFWRAMDSLRDKQEIEYIFKFKKYLLKR